MTANELLQLAQELNIALESYAMVTVVRVTPPTSAAPGAQAIVRADGSLHGWIGGGCAKSAVVSAALEAMRLGVPKLVLISNEPVTPNAGVELHRMPCASNGEIELFIHPHAAAPLLLVLGTTSVAAAARDFAERAGFRVTDAPGDAPQIALVATQGDGDEAALEAALAGPAARVLLIASARKAAKLRDAMLLRGITEERLAALEESVGGLPVIVGGLAWVLGHRTGSVALGDFIGGPKEIGRLLFRDFLFPFEVTSVLILIAIMGAVVLARREER